MTLGRKLFFGFISASLLGITLFGYVTFQNTRTIQMQQLASSTAATTRQLAELLSSKDVAAIRESLLHLADIQQTLDYELFITGPNGAVMLEHTYRLSAAQLLSLAANGKRDYLRLDDGYLFWSQHAIGDTGLTLYMMRMLDQSSFSSFLKASGIPLLIVSLILLWLATWGAIILSSLYRRLDQQRLELEFQTLHDSLTGLPNRANLIDSITARMALPLASDESLALIIIDINRLKEVNDTLGHAAGDNLLLMFVARVQQLIRDSDLLARIVSDEFALLVSGIPQERVMAVASRVQDALNEGFQIAEHELYIGATLGIAFYPAHALDADNLIKHAELAMYAAKRIGMDCSIYDETHNTTSLEQLKLVSDLRNDLEARRIRLYFQPKIELQTGRVCGLEALARWTHPGYGHIATSRFIHIAENTGLINNLTHWVLDHALQRARELQEHGQLLNMSINLSAWNLQDTEMVGYVSQLLEHHGVAAEQITLEITETAMVVNYRRAFATLQGLHQLGVRISIDDFGTGYSSLAYLKRLPLDEVKIDKSFVKSMRSRSNDESLVRAIIDLAHDLDLMVVAEGVESAEVASALQEIGCDQAQGNYYSEAIPFDELLEWLKKDRD